VCLGCRNAVENRVAPPARAVQRFFAPSKLGRRRSHSRESPEAFETAKPASPKAILPQKTRRVETKAIHRQFPRNRTNPLGPHTLRKVRSKSPKRGHGSDPSSRPAVSTLCLDPGCFTTCLILVLDLAWISIRRRLAAAVIFARRARADDRTLLSGAW